MHAFFLARVENVTNGQTHIGRWVENVTLRLHLQSKLEKLIEKTRPKQPSLVQSVEKTRVQCGETVP